MANSYVDYGVVGALSADQQSGTFAGIALDYLASTDLKVTITNGTTNVSTEVPAGDAITVTGSPGNSTIQLNFGEIEGYDSLAASDMVRITRSSSIDKLQRTFTDGSVLKASDLNTQHKQLLFGIQEQIDGGLGSLPLDTDDKYDAGSKAIKNLATPEGNTEAATKLYVDNTALYGAAFGHSEPQSWSFTTALADVEGSNRELILSTQVGTDQPSPGPIPAATADDFFIVELGGVIQAPATYTVSSETVDTTTTYTLTLLGAGGDPPIVDNGVDVSVRNFGIARNVFLTDITPDNDSSVGISITGYSAGQSADLQQWKEHDGTVLASVGEDGSMTTTGSITATGNVTTSGNITADRADLGSGTDDITGELASPIRIQSENGGELRAGVSSVGAYITNSNTDKSIRLGIGTGNLGPGGSNCLLELNRDGDGGMDMQGPVDILGSGDLTLSGSNNLNIASGVLKMGGLSTLQIVGVHLFRHDWNRNTGKIWVETGYTSGYVVTGHRLAVTPSSANSRFFFTGSLRVWASGAGSTTESGVDLRLHEGNDEEIGSASNGGTVTGPSDHGGHSTDRDESPAMLSMSPIGDTVYQYMSMPYTFLTPTIGSTDPKVYDMVFKMYSNTGADERVGYYATADTSTMYAIEYIDPS